MDEDSYTDKVLMNLLYVCIINGECGEIETKQAEGSTKSSYVDLTPMNLKNFERLENNFINKIMGKAWRYERTLYVTGSW